MGEPLLRQLEMMMCGLGNPDAGWILLLVVPRNSAAKIAYHSEGGSCAALTLREYGRQGDVQLFPIF